MSIISNTFFSTSGKILQAVLSIISSVFLARLIDPTDFGVYALIIATYKLFSGFLDIGLTPSYIKTNNPTQGLRNSFFTINVFLGISTTILLIISAPIISVIYKDSQLLILMILFSFTALISSISSQCTAELTRNKKFGKLLIVDVISSLITLILSVGAAFLGYGIWTFIIAAFSSSLSRTILVIYLNSNFKYDIVKYGEIKKYSNEIKFGLKIFLGRIFNGIFHSMDKLILGNSINFNSLGQYRKSQEHALMIDTHLRMPFGSVIYSYVERYSESNKKIIYFKLGIISLIITVMANGLLFLNGDIIYLFVFGNNWQEASVFIKFFAMFSMAMSLKGVYTTISMSQDKMNKQNLLTFVSIIVLGLNIAAFLTLNYSLLNFVKYSSISIFTFWAVLLNIEYFLIDKKNQFFKYFTLIIFVVFICNIVKNYLIINPTDKFIYVSILFELIMLFVLALFLKTSVLKKNTY